MARAADPVLAREVATGIVRRLREAGHIAYFAGGCVRDELLSLRPTDFDVATDATPPRVRELFPRTAEVGAAFGVVLVYEEGVTVEVATFRSDGPYTDARRPDVIHFSSPEEDARRRDFTINALFLDPLQEPGTPGRVIDFVDGQRDLAAGVLRAVGDPDKRLAEDHLRALRAVRFAARLGFAIDSGTAAAITRHASELRGVSRERIGDELRRMMGHPARADAIGLLERLGLDALVLNEPRAGPGPGGALLGAIGSTEPSFAACLAAWCLVRMGASETGMDNAQIGGAQRVWRPALCLSNEETEEFSDVLQIHAALLSRWGSMRVSERKRLAWREGFGAALELVRAALPAVAERISKDVKDLEGDGVGVRPAPLIDGQDLIGMGLTPGPVFKRVLDEVMDAQLEGKVRSKGEAMELARTLRV